MRQSKAYKGQKEVFMVNMFIKSHISQIFNSYPHSPGSHQLSLQKRTLSVNDISSRASCDAKKFFSKEGTKRINNAV